MAPSATTEIIACASKVGVAEEIEKHVHGGEGKTPLEAISQGPLIHPGEVSLDFSVLFSLISICFWVLSKP
jgi:hypothetical protein